jgi:hypothetical protein
MKADRYLHGAPSIRNSDRARNTLYLLEFGQAVWILDAMATDGALLP